MGDACLGEGKSGVDGPLAGVRVVELAGIGPAPFAAMLLADMGAEVVRIERVGGGSTFNGEEDSIVYRGRRGMVLDLKAPAGLGVLMDLVRSADVLIEGFRPGVMERLGAGPEACFEQNARLVYSRVTGWGQTGPYASVAGHDLNYISIAGALSLLGVDETPPTPPLNIVGDYNGGAMLCAYGIVCALFYAGRSGRGQVVDSATLDTMALVLSSVWSSRAAGTWVDTRNMNALDGGAHFYNVYECKDGKYVSIAAVESRFYAELLERLELNDPDWTANKWKNDDWAEFKERLAELFKSKTRDEWCELLEYTDTCFAPVLSPGEAIEHPQNQARSSFIELGGIIQPAPAPKLSLTPGRARLPWSGPSEPDEVLLDWGYDADTIEARRREGAFG